MFEEVCLLPLLTDLVEVFDWLSVSLLLLLQLLLSEVFLSLLLTIPEVEDNLADDDDKDNDIWDLALFRFLTSETFLSSVDIDADVEAAEFDIDVDAAEVEVSSVISSAIFAVLLPGIRCKIFIEAE